MVVGSKRTDTYKAAILVSILALVAYLLIRILYPSQDARNSSQTLPLDVDHLVKDYEYSDIRPEGLVVVRGKQLVRRGEKLLGLRSTVAKSTVLDTVQGRYSSATKKMSFSAGEGEWKTSSDMPLTLKNGVVVILGSQKLIDTDSAKIYLDQGKIVTFGMKKRQYHFK